MFKQSLSCLLGLKFILNDGSIVLQNLFSLPSFLSVWYDFGCYHVFLQILVL